MAMEQPLLDALKTEVPLWCLCLYGALGFLIGLAEGRAEPHHCSDTPTVTTYIAPSERPVSGLEFLTMAPMPSAGTASPPDSYARAKASSLLPMPAAGPL